MIEKQQTQAVIGIVLAILLRGTAAFAQASRPASAPTSRPTVQSPEVAPDGRVTFRLWAPLARSVFVLNIGHGGNGYDARTELTTDARGVWSATTPALPPDVYAYSFSVDGMTILDPSNPKLQTGFLGHQSQFTVPGHQLWERLPGVEHGAVTEQLYHSNVAGDDRTFWVYTPPHYDAQRADPYPTLFLLHGLGDRSDSWLENGAANLILDNLIAQGKAVPMVVVMTLGYGTSAGPINGRKAQNIDGFSRALLEEVLPRIQQRYHVAADPSHRAIAGLSMGGGEATYVGLNHLDVFGYIGSFSGAYSLWPTALRDVPTTQPSVDAALIEATFPHLTAATAQSLKLLWIACGTSDHLIDMNRVFHDALSHKQIATTYIEVPDIGHVWPLWRRNLAAFAMELFK